MTPNTGWPQQTGITEPTAVAKLSGGFAEMDTDTCVVYSFGGAKLNSVQSGYAAGTGGRKKPLCAVQPLRQ